jgi:hypothetical protein
MPEYLVHVGPHKTGTTYLQLRFAAARERLRQRRVIYPAEWSSTEDEPSHRKLVIGLREGHVGQLQSQFERIERSGPECVLISAEGINQLEPSALRLLKTLTHGHPISVMFYCRRWSELLPSLWQEKVKHGHDETFAEFFSANMSDPFNSPVLNFARRLDIYVDIFGRKNIKLVSYSNVCDSTIDLAGHFFDSFLPKHRSLLDDSPNLKVARPNQSLPPLDIEVIRALNSLNIRHGKPPTDALRNWYLAHAGRFDLAGLFSAIQANRATVSFSDASSGTQGLLETLSAAYADLMVQPARSEYLFAPRQAQIVFFHQYYLADRSARHALDEMYQAFRNECHV